MVSEINYRLLELIKDAKRIAKWHRYNQEKTIANHLIKNDVVPVIRCKKCKWFRLHRGECLHPFRHNFVSADDYCSKGERKVEHG